MAPIALELATLMVVAFTPIDQNIPTQAPPRVILPAPTGPFSIGTYTVTITDSTRRDLFASGHDQPRHFAVQAWYPTSRKASAPPGPYVPDSVAAAYTISLGLTTGFQANLYAHAQPGAVPIPGAQSMPTVLFSHGLGETRFSYVSLFEDLASHGYLVLAIDHVGSNRATQFPDGRVGHWDDSRWHERNRAALDAAIGEYYHDWSLDARSLLTTLQTGRRAGLLSSYARGVDWNRVAYVGHSYGGLSAVYTGMIDRRVKAAANLDGGVFTVPKPIALTIPLLVLANNADTTKRRDYTPTKDLTFVRVRGSEHMSFSDVPFLLERFRPPAPAGAQSSTDSSGVATIARTRTLVRGFLDCHLRALRCREFQAFAADAGSIDP